MDEVNDALRNGVEWSDLGELKPAAREGGYNKSSWKRALAYASGGGELKRTADATMNDSKLVFGWSKCAGGYNVPGYMIQANGYCMDCNARENHGIPTGSGPAETVATDELSTMRYFTSLISRACSQLDRSAKSPNPHKTFQVLVGMADIDKALGACSPQELLQACCGGEIGNVNLLTEENVHQMFKEAFNQHKIGQIHRTKRGGYQIEGRMMQVPVPKFDPFQ